MGNAQKLGHQRMETALCESDLGFELLDMLAQANIDFRRLPVEELQSLMGKTQARAKSPSRRCLELALV